MPMHYGLFEHTRESAGRVISRPSGLCEESRMNSREHGGIHPIEGLVVFVVREATVGIHTPVKMGYSQRL